MTENFTSKNFDVAVIGGGAAGYFGAIRIAEQLPNHKVVLLEATRKVLTKVRISGGGRCNVTHNCFEPRELIKNYPRGHRELLQAFSRFQPQDTVAWFRTRGVELHVESDGRMFPTTNSSETIVDTFLAEAKRHRVILELGSMVKSLEKKGTCFAIKLQNGHQLEARAVLLATGSFPGGHALARSMGHVIEPPVPSLFTFVVKDKRINELSGLSFAKVNAKLKTENEGFTQSGPLLITHWGFSGPAVLKLSAWAARALFNSNYNAELEVNFLPERKRDELVQEILAYKSTHPNRSAKKHPMFQIPSRYWESLVDFVTLEKELKYAELSKLHVTQLVDELCQAKFQVQGKGEFKEEFVTCGGVSLKEVDFKTLESKLIPGLFFAGEVLDVDGITGGFNFQNAWTTSTLAANAIAEKLD